MPVKVSFISNCDDAVVFWRIEKRIPDCWGFEIEREMKLKDGTVQRSTLDNRMGFKADNPKSGDHRASTLWPFQRFWWADHAANLGDVVRYRVTPMVRTNGTLQELVSARPPQHEARAGARPGGGLDLADMIDMGRQN